MQPTLEKLLALNAELSPGNLIVVDEARIRIRLPESEQREKLT